MTTVSWLGSADGNWNLTPSDWSSGAPPRPRDDVLIDAGRVSITSLIATVASVTIDTNGLLTIHDPGEVQSIAGNVDNSGNLWVDFAGIGGSALDVTGVLLNSGALAIGNTGLTAPAEVTVGGLDNTGSILLVGNATPGSDLQATLDVTGAVPDTWTGEIRIAGDADLILQNGITAIDSNALFEVDGAQARASIGADTTNSALAGLASNAGRFNLGSTGAVVTTTGDLDNSGNINVDFNGIGGNTLSIGGTFTNSGVLAMGGTELQFSSEMDVADDLVNTGAMQLVGNSAAGVTLLAPNLDNSGTLRLDSIGAGGGNLYVAGELTNSGSIGIGNTHISTPSEVAAHQLVNTGTIDLFGNAYQAARLQLANLFGVAINYGTIAATGSGSTGLILEPLSTVTNFGVISGDVGIAWDQSANSFAAKTIVNAGVITGYSGTAIDLRAALPEPNTLVIDEGAVFNGIVYLGGGGSSIELAGPPPGGNPQYPGLLPGIDSNFIDFSGLTVDAGAVWEVSGDASAHPIVNDGTVIVANGIDPAGEVLVFGALGEGAGSRGVIEVGGGGIVDFTAAVDHGQTLRFTDSYGGLLLGDPGEFAARIAGFTGGDVIDLVGVPADRFSYKSGELTLREGGSKVAVLSLQGHYTRRDFLLTPDAGGGTYVTLTAASPAERDPLQPATNGFWAVRG